jgi:hypothetical protein
MQLTVALSPLVYAPITVSTSISLALLLQAILFALLALGAVEFRLHHRLDFKGAWTAPRAHVLGISSRGQQGQRPQGGSRKEGSVIRSSQHVPYTELTCRFWSCQACGNMCLLAPCRCIQCLWASTGSHVGSHRYSRHLSQPTDHVELRISLCDIALFFGLDWRYVDTERKLELNRQNVDTDTAYPTIVTIVVQTPRLIICQVFRRKRGANQRDMFW